jgi:glycosyltransferase involved in cell wall biosynthesis
MPISVIISTYNSPEWLEKVVWGYHSQTYKDFELLIADDGSDDRTKTLVERLTSESAFPVRHVWHEHNGFGKCTILNKAITECDTDYVVVSDGDCIPRADFLYAHASMRQAGRFISGGYCKLPLATSKSITREDVATQLAFEPDWLREHGMKSVPLKLTATGAFAKVCNVLTPTKPSWNGHNASAWKRDILAVNGFNEEMQYGGEDRELGERLVNLGIRPIQARHFAICVHLDHTRGYKVRELVERNNAIRRETRKTCRTWTENGIVKGPTPKID